MKTIFLMFVFATGVFAQERFVKPVDDAKKDASFLAFRTKLIAAVKRKDAKYVISIADPKIRIDFGGGGGIAAFKEYWDSLTPDSRFWGQFLPVISNGGMFSKEAGEKNGTFWAPYVFDAFPPELDSTEYEVIFGKDVNLRSAPSLDAEIVGKLSYNVVKVDRDNAVADEGMSVAEEIYTGTTREFFLWMKVTTLGGKTGYVKDEYVRSPIDYRAGFEKKRGVWKMVFFLAGD